MNDKCIPHPYHFNIIALSLDLCLPSCLFPLRFTLTFCMRLSSVMYVYTTDPSATSSFQTQNANKFFQWTQITKVPSYFCCLLQICVFPVSTLFDGHVCYAFVTLVLGFGFMVLMKIIRKLNYFVPSVAGYLCPRS